MPLPPGMYTVQSTLYTVHCTLYTVHYSLSQNFFLSNIY
jgi:hypothetical protein